MQIEWSADEVSGLVLGTVDGHDFGIVRHGDRHELSFGEWGMSCSWHLRDPGAPAALDGWGQLDLVPQLVVLRGSLPAGSVRAETVRGDDRTSVVLLSAEGSDRPGWVGFSRLAAPAVHVEWFDGDGALLGRLSL